MPPQDFEVISSKLSTFTVFDTVLLAKLEAKGSHKIEIHEFKLDKVSDGNLMPIRMYKLFGVELHKRLHLTALDCTGYEKNKCYL